MEFLSYEAFSEEIQERELFLAEVSKIKNPVEMLQTWYRENGEAEEREIEWQELKEKFPDFCKD